MGGLIQNNFNIKEYLELKGIKYSRSGKNTIKGAISTRCPFHNDHSNHLNFFNDSLFGKCWHCGWINLKKYIREIEECSWRDVHKILDQHQVEFFEEEEREEKEHPNFFKMPKEFKSSFSKKHKEYLATRNFNWRELRSKYQILTSGNAGRYKFRIIFPIIMGGKIISFVGRDITGKQSLKYSNCPDDLSVLPRKDWVFNIDNVKTDSCIVCEGILDAIRLGDGAVSFLTTNFTTNQILKLKEKGVKHFFIAFDSDDAGVEHSEKLEAALGWADSVNYIDLPEGVNDPAELSEEEVRDLRIQIF